jgi:hypothetical protein
MQQQQRYAPQQQNVAAALPRDVLVRIFSFLPYDALAVTPGRVCRAWAAAKADTYAAALQHSRPLHERWRPFLPLWYVRSLGAARMPNIIYACFHGQLDVVAEVFEEGREWFDATACDMAAAGGQLQTLIWSAAKHGQLKILTWLVEQGCECISAASDHPECRAWLETLQARRGEQFDGRRVYIPKRLF